MKLKTFLNRRIAFTKTNFFFFILIAVIIGVLIAFYLPSFLKSLGFDFLVDNFLIISYVWTLLSSISVLTNIVFSNRKKKMFLTMIYLRNR